MIGLDTNVLLRLFIEDDPAQSDRARRFVNAAAADEPCIVNPVVLAEFAWTLARNFKIRRQEVARLIEGVLSMDDLEVPFRHAAEGALDAYRGGKADFPDYLLAAINAELGCASTATPASELNAQPGAAVRTMNCQSLCHAASAAISAASRVAWPKPWPET